MNNFTKSESKIYKLWMSKTIFWVLISFILLLFIVLSVLKSFHDSNEEKIKEMNSIAQPIHDN